MRAALYLRIFPEDPPREAKEQMQAMRALAKKNGWEVFRVYRDAEKTRRAFLEMRSDAQQRRFDVLLFWSLKQLARRGGGSATQFLHRLTTWGAGFCSCTEPHLDSCHELKHTVTSILATLAGQDRAYLSECTLSGLERQRKTHEPGPKGCLGPGRPRARFDQERARALRASNWSYHEIAVACCTSKATVQRYFKNRVREQRPVKTP